MAFDLTTAKPAGGFDLSSAQPVDTSQPLKIGKSGFSDALKDTLRGTDWATRNIAGAGQAVENMWEGIKGLAGQTNQDNVDTNRVFAEEAPIGTIAGVGAAMAPTAFIPGANTAAGSAAIGSVASALTTPGGASDRAKAGLAGGLGAGIGTKIGQMIAKLQMSKVSPAVSKLQQEQVYLTPGQNAGGVLKSLEDKATSIPFVGGVIDSARRRGIEDFNKAAFRRATLPGQEAPGIGREGLNNLRQTLGGAYDDVLSRSHANALDPEFIQQMSELRAMASGMPARERQMFDTIIDREIGSRMAPNGMLNAENIQAAKSGLGQEATSFATSTDAYQRQLGNALKQADANLRDLISRANPQNAQELQAIDRAYANFKRLQKAGSGIGAEEGIFTPAQLQSAVRAMDKTKDKSGFSERTALLQDLSEAGKSVMPSKVPNSGTADRLNFNPFSLQGLGNIVGGATVGLPVAAAYSRPGSAAINAGVNKLAIPSANMLKLLLSDPAVARSLGIGTATEFVR